MVLKLTVGLSQLIGGGRSTFSKEAKKRFP
jgi:hypothetical protein